MSEGFYHRPKRLLAGFHASDPSAAVPEIKSLGEQWAPVDFVIGSHEHQVWECYLQLDGRSRWQADGSHHDLSAGMWYLVRPGVEHLLVKRPTGQHHYLFAELDFDSCAERLGPEAQNCLESAPRFVSSDSPGIDLPFRQLIHESVFMAPWRDTALRLASDQLVLAFCRGLSHSDQEAILGGHPAVARARQLMDQQPGEPWKVADLARMVDCSVSHLCASFTDEVGQSIHQYLLENRIARAKRLLRDSDVSITQLALELGFSSSQHFAKQFKKSCAMSAREWRHKASH